MSEALPLLVFAASVAGGSILVAVLCILLAPRSSTPHTNESDAHERIGMLHG